MIPLALRPQVKRLEGRVRARLWAMLYRGVQVGRGAQVGRGCRLLLDPGAELVLGDSCTVDDGATVAVYGRGCLQLESGVFVGHHATLAVHRLIVVGRGTFLAEMVSVRDHDHAVGPPPSSGRVEVDPVRIGASVWLGAKCTVLRGARIGDGSVVGANAVVRGVVPAHSVAVGVPARVVGSAARQVGP